MGVRRRKRRTKRPRDSGRGLCGVKKRNARQLGALRQVVHILQF